MSRTPPVLCLICIVYVYSLVLLCFVCNHCFIAVDFVSLLNTFGGRQDSMVFSSKTAVEAVVRQSAAAIAKEGVGGG